MRDDAERLCRAISSCNRDHARTAGALTSAYIHEVIRRAQL